MIWKLQCNSKYRHAGLYFNKCFEYVDTANKAFIFGEGRYMVADDLSMGGRRLNNVGMPVENHQTSNKFYVDTLVEQEHKMEVFLWLVK